MAIACQPAAAATLSTDKGCYREAEPVALGAGPFTASGAVDLTRDGALLPGSPFTADATGHLTRRFPAPGAGPTGERSFSILAEDRADPPRRAAVTRRVARLDLTLRPAGGRASLMRRITARGFTGPGTTLHAHMVRGRRHRTVRVGRLSGPCGTISARSRLLRGARRGVYRVQFDTRRRYSRRTVPRVTYRVRISRKFLPRRSGSVR